jgi:hypothetical protein
MPGYVPFTTMLTCSGRFVAVMPGATADGLPIKATHERPMKLDPLEVAFT